MSPSSALLQDLLREKKASQRASRIVEDDDSTVNKRQVQSSPIGPSAASRSHSTRISGAAVPKDMGVREMEEYISKINKQNFDLKLEIFHRRQRTDALEVKAARVDELETQNDEFRQLNDDLLQELEKRDAAVGEAVSLICELEAKVDRLEREQQHNVRPTTPVRIHAVSPDAQSPGHVDPTLSTSLSPSTRKAGGVSFTILEDCSHTPDRGGKYEDWADDRLLRSPSFLHEDKPSTSALRRLFQNHERGSITEGFGSSKPSMLSLRRVGSPFSQDDSESCDGETLALIPQRLSLLSESSLFSVHGQNKEKTAPSKARDASPPRDSGTFIRMLSPQEGRIQQWIDNRNHPASESRRPPRSAKPDTFSSIGEVMGPNQPDSRDVPSSSSPRRPTGRPRQPQPQRSAKADSIPSLAGPLFGPDILPPTPETMSTATLEATSSNQSFIAEKTQNDGISGPTTSYSSNLPYPLSYGSDEGLRSTQDNGQQAFRSRFDNDTDLEIVDDEQHPAYRAIRNQRNKDLNDKPRATTLMGEDVKASRILSPSGSQRPRLNNHSKDMMSTRTGVETTKPSRTISYPSPRKHYDSSPQDLLQSSEQTSIDSSDRKAPASRQGSSTKPTLPRSLSSHSQLSQPTTTSAPAQTLAARLFRRSPSSTLPASTQPEITSPESKLGQPRPTSLYIRTTSTPAPSLTAPLQIPRPSRPGTAGGPGGTISSSRPHSGVFAPGIGKGVDAAPRDRVDESEQQALPSQQPSKRLSVGAIGRSASLRIKEGFGRKSRW